MNERVTLGQRRPSPWWETWRWWRSSRSKKERRRGPRFCNEPGTRSSQREQKLRDIKKESPGRRCPRPSLDQVAGTWRSSMLADRSNLRSSSSSLRMSLWRKRGTTSCWALNICFCKNLRVLCDVDDHGDDKMNNHGLAHLAYILLIVCCPCPGEMRCDSCENVFSSSDFRSFCLVDFPHFSNIFLMSPFDSTKRQNMTLTVFKVHFFFGFLVFLSSEFYAFLQYIFPVSPYNFAIHHSFGNYDLSSRFIKQPVYVL